MCQNIIKIQRNESKYYKSTLKCVKLSYKDEDMCQNTFTVKRKVPKYHKSAMKCLKVS